MRAVLKGAIILGLGLALADAAQAGPGMIDLVPHRAVYDMTLASTSSGAGVTAASGAMTYKFSDACDGWTVENRTALTFSYSDGAPVATTWDFVTWESKDGLHYRFRVRSTRDGVVSDEVDGVANLDGKGRGGKAVFSAPEDRVVLLPKGTLFPTEHTLRLLESALAAGRPHMMGKILFDGTGDDGAFDVSAMIGKTLPPDPSVRNRLLAMPSWRMQMAFYPVGSNEAMPDYEVGLRYYLNGIADEVLQSFGSFTVKGRLKSLEALPKPDC